MGNSIKLVALAIALYVASAARADSVFGLASSFSRPHPAVVRVAVPERDGASYGSGSLVAVNESSGLILTNWHVVRDVAGPIVVYFPDGFYSVAYLLRTDRDWDLAALAIRRPNVQPIPLAAEPPRPGDLLMIAGYGSGPYRAVTGQCTQYLSPGENQPLEMIEVSVAARNGDSGGPILNDRGELAGVLFGSAFDRTSGSYCGRLRWFLAQSDNEFRRISAQALLAQQSKRQQQQQQPQQPPVAAINSPLPMGDGQGVRAAKTASNSPLPMGEGQGVRATETASSSPRPPAPGPAPLVPVGSLTQIPENPSRHETPLRDNGGTTGSGQGTLEAASYRQPSVSAASIPAPSRGPSSSTDQFKTIFAAIGVLAVLYHALRLLGKAVG